MARKNKPALDHSDIKRICNSLVLAVLFIIAYACYPKAFWAIVVIILGILCIALDGKIPTEFRNFSL